MSADTLRPTVPADACDAWPMCGRDVVGHCPCAPAGVPTVPAPRVDPVPALVTAALAHRLDGERLRRGVAALPALDAARYHRALARALDVASVEGAT